MNMCFRNNKLASLHKLLQSHYSASLRCGFMSPPLYAVYICLIAAARGMKWWICFATVMLHVAAKTCRPKSASFRMLPGKALNTAISCFKSFGVRHYIRLSDHRISSVLIRGVKPRSDLYSAKVVLFAFNWFDFELYYVQQWNYSKNHKVRRFDCNVKSNWSPLPSLGSACFLSDYPRGGMLLLENSQFRKMRSWTEFLNRIEFGFHSNGRWVAHPSNAGGGRAFVWLLHRVCACIPSLLHQ